MRKLQWVERVACEEGEKAVEACGIVEGEGEGDEFGCCAERDEVEEGLSTQLGLSYVVDSCGSLREV